MSRQLCAQHHHSCNPEKDEVTACLQNGIGVEMLDVSGLLGGEVVVRMG